MSSINRICPFCDKIFVNEAIIKQHISFQHLGLKSLQKPNQQILEDSDQNMSKNLKVETSENCKYCGKILKNFKTGYKHSVKRCEAMFNQRYLGKKHQCNNCLRSFNSGRNLKRHRQIIHEKVRFQCTKCPKSCSTVANLKYHTLKYHKLEYIKTIVKTENPINPKFDDNIECEACEKRFLDESFDSDYVCKRCGKSSNSKQNNKQGLIQDQSLIKQETMENPNENLVHLCESCGKNFKNFELSNNHFCEPKEIPRPGDPCGKPSKYQQLCHQKTESFNCDQCSKTFTKNYKLNKHKKLKHPQTHNSKSCENCGKSISNSIFQKHLKKCEIIFQTKYSGHRFQCQNCKRSFPSRWGFRHHNKSVHENIRFTCDQCDKVFTSFHGLKLHNNAEHLGVLYFCDHCDMNYKYKEALKYHNKTKHLENLNDSMDPSSMMEFTMSVSEETNSGYKNEIFQKSQIENFLIQNSPIENSLIKNSQIKNSQNVEKKSTRNF